MIPEAEAYDILLGNLARARQALAGAKAVQQGLLQRVKYTPEFLGAAEVETTALLAVGHIETELHRKALEDFSTTGDKRPHPAIGIRVITKLQYGVADALEFAKAHIPAALKLDAREFEKAARVLKPPFVTEASEPQATIATDLSEYLPKASE